MTAIRALNALAGLSIRESAAFLDARVDTVEAWSRGKNPTPPGVIDELRTLIAKQEAAAAAALAAIPSPSPDGIELRLASDDVEAQALGWPCVGAHRAVLARVAAGAHKGVRVLISPCSPPIG